MVQSPTTFLRGLIVSFCLGGLAQAAPPALPKGFTQGPSVEGVTEYDLANGLRVLLIPDESVSNITVSTTVLVGSRHEGYGEKGMAHLLEHMMFKGTPKHRDVKKELAARGAKNNANTRQDRTHYFDTLPASDDNLDYALRMEADRLVNSFVEKADLDAEMTVVRNEFERSENDGIGVLLGRVRAAALPWHNYGRVVIGIKADIEMVPINNLKAFYRRYYQPDNTVVMVAGKFDTQKALTIIADSFGKIPKPSRSLPDTLTTEPTQDGERTVAVRRVGGMPALAFSWRIPSSADPDYPALKVLQAVLGDTPQGRLHQALVETKKATFAQCFLFELKEPDLFTCVAGLSASTDLEAVRTLAFSTSEGLKPVSADEVSRAQSGLIAGYESMLKSAEGVSNALANAIGQGDWRLIFLQRDRIQKVTPEDVQRVAARYLTAHNRTSGEYAPTETPRRAEIPALVDVPTLLKGYVGQPPVAKGENFEATPKNIEARTRRVTLANGAKLALLPKKTRAESVQVAFEIPMGTEKSLQGQSVPSYMAALMLNRGTSKLSYKNFSEALQRLKAKFSVTGDTQKVSVRIETTRPQLAEVLKLTKDALRAPAFDAQEFEIARKQALAGIEASKSEPTAVGPNEMKRALAPFPKEHALYTHNFDELIAAFKTVTLAQAKDFYTRFYGAQNASGAVVGDFDDKEVESVMGDLLGSWTSKEPYALVPDVYRPAAAASLTIATPDKQNAWMGYGTTLKMSDSDSIYPAINLATSLLGGGPSGRLFGSLREKKGLTYGAYASLETDSQNDRSEITTTVIYAPQNATKVEASLQEEFERWSIISKQDLDFVRGKVLGQRQQRRADDSVLVELLADQGLVGRTMLWEDELDAKYQALSADQLAGAVQKMVDPKNLVKVKAGDFKTIVAPK
jgi:zinc protease